MSRDMPGHYRDIIGTSGHPGQHRDTERDTPPPLGGGCPVPELWQVVVVPQAFYALSRPMQPGHLPGHKRDKCPAGTCPDVPAVPVPRSTNNSAPLTGTHPMRHLLAAALIVAPLSAYAWTDPPPAQTPAPWAKATASPTITANPTAHARASSNATAGALATGGHASASQSQTVVVGSGAGAQAPSAAVLASGWNGMPVASAVAPPITTYNPCGGAGASMAAQTPMFGLSAGGTSMDTACQIMNTRMPWAPEWAAATLCRGDRDVRRAALDIGHPCPQDVQRVSEPVAAPPVVTAPPAEPTGANGYCYEHMTAAERARHPECGH